MYLEEKIINGILHYRTSPNEDFKPYTAETLTGKFGTLKEEMQKQKQIYSELVDLLERLRTIYIEDCDLDIKYNKKRLEFIEKFK